MYEEHAYHFHPSILRASRQIEREASHVLYNENSLVRVSSCGKCCWVDDCGLVGKYDGYSVPILAAYERAHKFTRHTMEFVMLREDTLSDGSDLVAHSFVITGDDLQGFCYILLRLNAFSRTRLDQVTLAIEVFSERDAAIAAPYEKDNALIDGEDPLRGNCSIEATTSTKDDDLIPSKMPIVWRAPTEEGALTLDQAINPRKHATSVFSSPRVLKLLEPLHKLHSLHGVYIEGPIGDDDKTALLFSMLGLPPSDLKMFDVLLSKFEDAMSTYDTGDQEAGSIKLELTLDTIKDQMSSRKRDWGGNDVIPQGAPYAGYTVRNAQRDIQVQVYTKLAWRFLEIWTTPHARAAKRFANMILGDRSDPNSYWQLPAKGNEAAMAFYLAAHATDAQGKLKDIPRLESLESVVRFLQLALQHEPGNLIVKQEMEKKEDELKLLKALQKGPKYFNFISDDLDFLNIDPEY